MCYKHLEKHQKHKINIEIENSTNSISHYLCLLSFQVTEEMVDILGASGHSCHLRGPIFVKGKGTITTYFVKTPFDK